MVSVSRDSSDSISSTISVERRFISSDGFRHAKVDAKSGFNAKRIVRFALDATVTYSSNPIDQNDASKLFYSHREIKAFKKDALDVAGLLERSDSFGCSALQRAYSKCCTSISEPTVLTFRSMASDMEQKHMRQTATKGLSIGLEKLLVKNMLKDRSRRQREIYELVMDLQDFPVENNELADLIRKGCENISRPNRLFAVAVAQSHAS